MTATYTAPSSGGPVGDELGIELLDRNFLNGAPTDFDNVRLSNSLPTLPTGPTGVPLPSAAATMPVLLGLAGMTGYSRFNRRRLTPAD
jgi:hypothetical protein